jgi:hypothetical protein
MGAITSSIERRWMHERLCCLAEKQTCHAGFERTTAVDDLCRQCCREHRGERDRLGKQARRRVAANVTTLESAVLELLALMIGSQWLCRFETRRDGVLNEASNWHTALRTRLLSAAHNRSAQVVDGVLRSGLIGCAQRVPSPAELEAVTEFDKQMVSIGSSSNPWNAMNTRSA